LKTKQQQKQKPVQFTTILYTKESENFETV